MTLTIRRAAPLDARPMADLLNAIIAQGGTTAFTNPLTTQDMLNMMDRDPRSIWFVAEDAKGEVLGFQYSNPHGELGNHVAQIATFAQIGRTGLGIGSALFNATREAAIEAGYKWINAEIRADNEGGLIFYQSRGFEDYGRIKGVMLADGMVVDKVLKRYDL